MSESRGPTGAPPRPVSSNPPTGTPAGAPPADPVPPPPHGGRRVSIAKAPSRHTPPAPANPPSANPGLAGRNPASSPTGGPAGSSPLSRLADTPQPTSLQEAIDQQKAVLDELWIRDQLELIAKIVDNPQLAAQLGCVVKVKLPNTTQAVQVFPMNGDIGPDHLPRYLQPLKGSALKALEARQNITPDHLLYDSYIVKRNTVFEIGRREAHSKGELFDYQAVFPSMLQGSLDQKFTTEGISFSLTRQDPDPRHADQLNQMRQGLNQGKSKRKLMPPKGRRPHTARPEPTPSTALHKPGVDLRLSASSADIDRLTEAERRAAAAAPPSGPPHGAPPPAGPPYVDPVS